MRTATSSCRMVGSEELVFKSVALDKTEEAEANDRGVPEAQDYAGDWTVGS